MPKISPERSSQRRHALIAAARSVIINSGFSRLTVDSICAAAGLSKGAFYGYFASKDEVLEAAFESDRVDFDLILRAVDANELCDALLDIFPLDQPEVSRVEVQAWVHGFSDQSFRERLVKGSRDFHQHLTEAIVSQGKENEPLDSHAKVIASILQSFLMGSFVRSALREEKLTDIDAELRLLVATLLRGRLGLPHMQARTSGASDGARRKVRKAKSLDQRHG